MNIQTPDIVMETLAKCEEFFPFYIPLYGQKFRLPALSTESKAMKILELALGPERYQRIASSIETMKMIGYQFPEIGVSRTQKGIYLAFDNIETDIPVSVLELQVMIKYGNTRDEIIDAKTNATVIYSGRVLDEKLASLVHSFTGCSLERAIQFLALKHPFEFREVGVQVVEDFVKFLEQYVSADMLNVTYWAEKRTIVC